MRLPCYPPLMAFLLAVVLTDVPFMIGVMLSEGRRLNGRFTLERVVLYRERVTWKTFAWVSAGAFAGTYLLLMAATPIDSLLAERVFSWLPRWIFMDDAAVYAGYGKSVLVIVFTLHLLITGILLPWVEELYFRGYLLPRISRYGGWAPLIGASFFGLYHVWQLFGFVGVFLLGAGLGYVVWWKRDIRLSIGLHVAANALGHCVAGRRVRWVHSVLRLDCLSREVRSPIGCVGYPRDDPGQLHCQPVCPDCPAGQPRGLGAILDG